MFSLNKTETTKLNEWIKIKYATLVEQQRGTEFERFHVQGEDGIVYPYLGAIGGGLTYQFTPNGLGTVVEVTWCSGTSFEDTIDLTDYACW